MKTAYITILLLLGVCVQSRKLERPRFGGRSLDANFKKDRRLTEGTNIPSTAQPPTVSFDASNDSAIVSASSIKDINIPAPSNNHLQQIQPNNEINQRPFFDGSVSLYPSPRKESVDPNEPAVSAGGFTPSVLAPSNSEPVSYRGANENQQTQQNNFPVNGFSYNTAESSNTNYQEAPTSRSSGGSSQQQAYGTSALSGYQQQTTQQQATAQASSGYEQQYGQQSSYGSSGSSSGQSNGEYSQQQGNGGEDGYGSSGPSTSVLAQQAANQAKAAQAAQGQAAATAAQQAAAALANQASEAAQKAASLVITKQQQAAQVSQAAQAAQSAAAAEAALAAQIEEAIQSTSGVQSQSGQLSQAVNDLVEAARSQGNTVQRVLQQLQAISSTQNQMARQAEQKARYLAQREDASLRDLAATQQAADKAALAARAAQNNVPTSGASYNNGQNNGYGGSAGGASATYSSNNSQQSQQQY